MQTGDFIIPFTTLFGDTVPTLEGTTEIPTGGLAFTILFTVLVMDIMASLIIIIPDTVDITAINTTGVMLGPPIQEDPPAIRIQIPQEEVVLLNTTPNPLIRESTLTIRVRPIQILRMLIVTT